MQRNSIFCGSPLNKNILWSMMTWKNTVLFSHGFKFYFEMASMERNITMFPPLIIYYCYCKWLYGFVKNPYLFISLENRYDGNACSLLFKLKSHTFHCNFIMKTAIMGFQRYYLNNWKDIIFHSWKWFYWPKCV